MKYYTGDTKEWPDGLYTHALGRSKVKLLKTDRGLFIFSPNQFGEPVKFVFLLLDYKKLEDSCITPQFAK
jgi:hypothetical protein